MSEVSDFFRQKPYTVKRVKTYAWFQPKWVMMFEDTPIREYHGSRAEMDEMLVLLNAAYCNGYSSGVLYGRYSNER